MDWKELLRRLGINPTRIEWKLMRWQEQWRLTLARLEVRGEQIAYKNKVCDGCGNVLEGNQTECPRCHTAGSSRSAQVARRVLSDFNLGNAPVTLTLIAVIVMLEFVMLTLYGHEMFLFPTSQALTDMGAQFNKLVLSGEWWRMMTAGYEHIGIIHLGFNVMALLQAGQILEGELGSRRFFVIYTLSLIGGSLAWLAMGPYASAAGASGAVFGLIGCGVAYNHATGRIQQRNFFVSWVLYGVVFSYFVGAAHAAHAGGFVTGLVLGFIHGRLRKPAGALTTVAAWLCLLVTLVSMGFLGANLVATNAARDAARQLDAEDATAARASIQRALTFAPRRAQYWILSAAIHDAAGRPDEALADCDRALALDPDDPRARLVKGTALADMHHESEAIPVLLQAAANSDKATMRSAALALMRCGAWQHAYDIVYALMEEGDTRPETRVLRIRCEMWLGMWNDVINDADELLHDGEHDADAHEIKCVAEVALHQDADALKDAAAVKDSEDVAYMQLMAAALGGPAAPATKQWPGPLAAWLASPSPQHDVAAPNDAALGDVHLFIGISLSRHGNTESARTHLAQVKNAAFRYAEPLAQAELKRP